MTEKQMGSSPNKSWYIFIGLFVIIILLVSGWRVGKVELFGIDLMPPSTSTPITFQTNTQDSHIQMVDFNYSDSPIKHGWFFIKGFDTTQVVFNPIYENQSVRGVEINSAIEWGMEISVEPAAMTFGKVLEFNIVPRKDGAVYAFINLSRSDGTKNTGWLKFMFCDDDIKSITSGSPGYDEWQICLAPVSHEGDWLLFQANLIDEVKRTFSENGGWSFSGLNQIRVRGNLSLDYISIREE